MSEERPHYEAEAEREAFEDALEAVREAAKAVETPEQFQALYQELSKVAGFAHRAMPVMVEGRPGEFVTIIRYSVVRVQRGEA